MPGNDFFRDLGKAMAATLASNPASSAIMHSTLGNHLRGGMARDQSLSHRPMAGGPRYDQDPNGAMIDADMCMVLIQKCVAGLDPGERDKLLGQLADFFQQDAGALDGNSGVRQNNMSALDRIRSGNRSARDSRRPAQDSALMLINSRGFNSRWGRLTAGIKMTGNGR